jgi:L-rhamnose mutarotase
MLNKRRINHFTIIMPENSIYMISCIGVDEKQKTSKISSLNNSKSWWRPFLRAYEGATTRRGWEWGGGRKRQTRDKK